MITEPSNSDGAEFSVYVALPPSQHGLALVSSSESEGPWTSSF